jgi:hypothetical protein
MAPKGIGVQIDSLWNDRKTTGHLSWPPDLIKHKGKGNPVKTYSKKSDFLAH